MGFAIYNGTTKRDREERVAAQRAAEKARQENLGRQLEANSARGIRREEREAHEALVEKRRARINALQAENEKLFAEWQKANVWLLSKPDPEHQTDPEAPQGFNFDPLTGKTGHQQAFHYSTEQFLKFQSETPEYVAHPDNANALEKYLQTNGSSTIVSAKQFKQAYNRLLEAGLLITGERIEKPEPEPQKWQWIQDVDWNTAKDDDIVAGRDIETGQPASYTFGDVKKFGTEELRRFISKDYREKSVVEPEYKERGIDPDTREERWYSDREINRMTPDQIKKTFVLGRKLGKVMPMPEQVSER